MARVLLGSLACVVLAACSTTQGASPRSTSSDLMGPAEFQALPSAAADYRIAYGSDPSQFADLRVPHAAGPHPVAILVHGGCWKADYATLRDMAPIAEALRADGIATWNVEYRRLGQAGGGWPGTFQDVGNAVDALRHAANRHDLDLGRVVLVGHSAGGQLALWAAARARLPRSSVLHNDNPLPVRGVVDLAGPADMQAEIAAEIGGCQSRVVEELLAGSPQEVPERYRQASPITMLPLGIPQVVIWGDRDTLRPIEAGEAYVGAARNAGDPAKLITLQGLGHFDVANPFGPQWGTVRNSIEALFKTPH